MMDAKGVRNNSIPVVVNKHNNAIVASCWFIVYYGMDCLTCDNTMLKISNKVSKFYSITFSIKFFFHKRIGGDKPIWLESEEQLFVNLNSGGK